MSTEQKNTISFIANTFAKVMLSLCGGLLTLLYVQMRADRAEDKAEFKTEIRQIKTEQREQGQDINIIKVDLADVKGYMKYNKK